jgi:hypothetical protein
MDSGRADTLIRELDVTPKTAPPLGMSEFEARLKWIVPALIELGWRTDMDFF